MKTNGHMLECRLGCGGGPRGRDQVKYL